MSGYKTVEADFSEDEKEKLERIRGGCCFTNSLVDFHESDGEDDDGGTVFSYTETLKYM